MSIRKFLRLQGTTQMPHFLRKHQLLNKRCLFQSKVHFQDVSKPSVLEKGMRIVRNDPFIKFSLSLCAIVIGATVGMELYKKKKKTAAPSVSMLVPSCAHHTIKRDSLILQLQDKIEESRLCHKGTCPVVYVTGSEGSGKTQLVGQFSDHYAASHYKWFGLKAVLPTVLYLDIGSPELMELSLIEAAHSLGLQQVQTSGSESLFSAVISKLASTQLPWLLVMDNLTEKTEFVFHSLVGKYLDDSCALGTILVTSRKPRHGDSSLPVSSRLSERQSSELLESIGNFQSPPSKSALISLVESLHHHPMAIALAATTIKMYRSLLPSSEWNTILVSYQELLANSLKARSDVDILQAALDLYFEFAVSDSRLRHTFDFLGSCALDCPLIVSVLPLHLGTKFFAITDEALAPPPLDPFLDKIKPPVGKDSGWNYIKSILPFGRPDIPTDEDIAKLLAASQDEVTFLRDSPILSFQRCCHGSFEFVRVHSVAFDRLPQLFSDTCQKLDRDHVLKEAKEFEENAWFKQYRSFDEKKSLKMFHHRLPGLSSPGVLTRAEFNGVLVKDSKVGTLVPDDLSHSQYLHIVSHYHRVVSSLTSALRAAKGDVDGFLLKKYLVPHLQAIKTHPLLSHADQLAINMSLLVAEMISNPSSELSESSIVTEYRALIAEQKKLYGTQSQVVARSLTDLANFYLSLNKPSPAKELLQSAMQVYKQIPARLAGEEFAQDVGNALSSTAMASGQLGEKQQSKQLYEEALASYQSIPPSGKVTRKQQRLVASVLIDVTHAHLCVGDFLAAKKYSGLATMMLQAVYPQGHMETVRLFNISSIVYALLGEREESTRLRTEASKTKSKIISRNTCKSL